MFHTGFKIILFNMAKVRIVQLSILLMLPFILLISITFLHFKSWIIIVSIVLYSFILLADTFMLIFVKEKMDLQNLNMGIQILIMSILLFSIFLYNVGLYFFLIPSYLIAVYVTARFIFKKRFFSYKTSPNNNGIYVWIGISLGGVFCRTIIVNNFIKYIIAMIICCAFSLLLMFISVQVICKYIYINKYKNTPRFYLEYE